MLVLLTPVLGSGGPSAGSLATMIALFEAYPFKFTNQALDPWALSPTPPPQPKPRTSPWVLWLFGSRFLKPLGIVANMPQAECDIGIVHRSWGLYDQGNYYGRKFHFNEYQYTVSRFKAFMMSWVLFWVQSGLKYFRPFRWLVKRILPTPGQGPPKADFKSYRTRFRAVATADSQPEHKVVADLLYKGSPYYLTGVLVVQAAMSLLNGGDSLAKKLTGYVTPATWGMELVDRMKQAGVEIDVAVVD